MFASKFALYKNALVLPSFLPTFAPSLAALVNPLPNPFPSITLLLKSFIKLNTSLPELKVTFIPALCNPWRIKSPILVKAFSSNDINPWVNPSENIVSNSSAFTLDGESL